MRFTLTLALLLWAVGAGADGTKPPSYQIAITGVVESDGELVVRLTDTYGKRVTTKCERDMREAMQAMDWYLPRALQRGEDERWRSYMQLSDAGHEAVVKALQQWTAAKACWREKGGP